MKFRYIYILLIMVVLSGCTTFETTYLSEGYNYSSLASIQNAYIKSNCHMTGETRSQITLTTPSDLRIGNVENVIIGSLLKHGISSISKAEFSKLTKKELSRTVVLEWGVSGRHSRGIEGITDEGFSQEVTVLIRNAASKKLVYRGEGEYMGVTEIDDLRGALLAALKNIGHNTQRP